MNAPVVVSRKRTPEFPTTSCCGKSLLDETKVAGVVLIFVLCIQTKDRAMRSDACAWCGTCPTRLGPFKCSLAIVYMCSFPSIGGVIDHNDAVVVFCSVHQQVSQIKKPRLYQSGLVYEIVAFTGVSVPSKNRKHPINALA